MRIIDSVRFVSCHIQINRVQACYMALGVASICLMGYVTLVGSN